MKTDVIIPCFNEGKRISNVVNVVKQSNCVNKIIVVDDGSNERTKSELNKINDITLITHKNNKGKTAAIKTGIEVSKTEKILFIDSDLTNLKVKHIDALCNKLDIDTLMVLGIRGREFFLNNATGMAVAFTGERAFWRKNLDNNIEIFNVNGYLLEPELNKRFFYKEDTKVVKMDGVGQTYKVFKHGINGIIDDIKMLTEYKRYLGLREFLRQINLGQKYAFSSIFKKTELQNQDMLS